MKSFTRNPPRLNFPPSALRSMRGIRPGALDWRLLLILLVGMVFRTVYACFSWSPDWDAFVGFGQSLYQNPQIQYGIYTAPAYLFAGFYWLWLNLPIVHSRDSLLFAMKLPSLTFDFLTALLIWKILSAFNVSKARMYWAVAAWLLNPLTLIADAFNGFEVVPSFLLLYSSYLAIKRKNILASISLTIGGLLRFVPFAALPFLLAKTVRSRDWKATIKLTVPLAVVLAVISVWLVFQAPGQLSLLFARGSGYGILRAEAFDFLGVTLSNSTLVYPMNPIAMTALGYIVLLAVLVMFRERQWDGSHGMVWEAYVPFLFYSAFSWSSVGFLMYLLPFAMIQLARVRAYKSLTILLSFVGILWSIIRSPTYIIQPDITVFFIPLYNEFLRALNVTMLSAALWLQSNFAPQIRGAFSAIMLFLTLTLLGKPVSQAFENKLATPKGM